MLRGMWDLPGPGLEPVSPALAGGFLTTAPPGKSICRLSDDGHSDWCEVIPHCSFDLHFSNNKISFLIALISLIFFLHLDM